MPMSMAGAAAHDCDLSLAIPTTSAAEASTFGRFRRLTLGRHIEKYCGRPSRIPPSIAITIN
jgi:hypothetical protein